MRFTQLFTRDESVTQNVPECFHDWCMLLDLWLQFPRNNMWNQKQRWYPSSRVQMIFGCNWTIFFRDTFFVCFFLPLPIPLYFIAMFIKFGYVDMILILYMVFTTLNSGIILSMVYHAALRSTFGLPATRHPGFASDGSIEEDLSSGRNLGQVGKGMVQAFRNRIASQAEDKAYAFYGVMDGLGANLPKIEYQESLGDVYHQFYSALLRWDTTLICLVMDAGLGRKKRLEDAPSWVPVFNDCASSRLDSRYQSGRSLHSATPAAESDFRYFTADSGISGDELTVLVQWHGAASFCSGPSGLMSPATPTNDDDAPPQTLSEHLSKHLLWYSYLRQKAPTSLAYETLSKAISLVLQGHTEELKDTPAEDRKAFNEWYSTLLEIANGITAESDFSDAATIESAVQTLVANSNAHGYFTKCCESLSTAQRNLVISSRGYIGSGPDTMFEGDKIAFVRGVPVPMVLRDAADGSGRYTVVGPAFVHGLMEGVGWDQANAQDVVLI